MYWKEWLQSLLSLVILLGILEMILPPGDLAKFSRLVFGLVLMLAILQPLTIILDQGVPSVDLTLSDAHSRAPEIEELSESIQLAATTPFLQQNKEAVVSELEDLLLNLEYIDNVRVEIRGAGQYGALIQVFFEPFATRTARSIGDVVGSVLNVSVSQVSVQPWVE